MAASAALPSMKLSLSSGHEKAVQFARSQDMASAYEYIQQAYQNDPEKTEVIADYIAISTWMEHFDEAVTLYHKHKESGLPDYAVKEAIKSLREVGNYEESIRLSESYLESHGKDLDVAIGLIYSLIQTKDYEKASQQLSIFVGIFPDALRLKSLQTLLFASQKQWDKFFDPIEGVRPLIIDGQDPAVLSDLNEGFYLVYDEAIAFARNGRFGEALGLLDQLEVFKHKSQQVEMDRIVIMAWQEKFGEAVDAYRQMDIQKDPPPYFLKEVARAYKKNGQEIILSDKHWQYITPYLQAIEEEEYQARLQLAFIRSHIEEGNMAEALRLIDDIPGDDPIKQEALFIKAEIYDAAGEYWKAVQVFNHILNIEPDNDKAINLKLRSLMDLGATSLVLEESDKHPDIVDPVVLERARTDVPMHRIQWEESKPALEEIRELEEKYARLFAEDRGDETVSENDQRIKWDRLLALRKEDKMDEVIAEYETLLEKGADIPPWVCRAAADAYLYLQKPEEALAIYDELLKTDQSFDVQMSQYYTFVELGRYKDAQAVLDRLDAITPAKIIRRGILQDNWEKADIVFNRAWLLLYQDRLKDAEEYIQKVNKVSPFNTNLRTAEAHTHLYRGWKRKALEDFKMIRTLDDRDFASHVGYARALNDNMQKKQAREEINHILDKKPTHKHAQRLKRAFDVEEMAQVTFGANYKTEDPGEDEYTLSLRGEKSVDFHHTLFAELIRRETTQEGDNDVARKIRVGDIWQINNNWRLVGAVTGDYEKSDDVGFLGEIRYQPDDYWTFDFGYESDTLDIASRSRKNGVEADLYTLSATYRMSELFDTTLGVTFKDFTDNNEYLDYFWRTDTALTTSAYWKTRLQTEFSYETFSDQDVDYFSPEETTSFYLVPIVEHTWFRRYEKAWVDRLYLGIGQKWQKDFGTSDAGYIRYEQDHQFSDTKSWLIGTTYSLNEYDGEGVNSLNVYTTLRFKF
ncbi:MAG: poly-beta-1,6 N-acetyl-D-glucosamine export porin PgaA [Candidatus Omnitrophica bacterium]|nr:poly-beta-1,6 N-acetyl-D-glucosamine export porin PgaA [Candidatus Omnitrophota bacterium]